MNALLHDIRYGIRMLLKHKGFTTVAILALGLGIGANTAIFSLVNGVLLRPLPFPNSERIVYFEGKNSAAGITDSNISYLDFTDWSQQTDLFASTAAYWTGGVNLGADGAEPERVPRAGVTTGFFSVLGVQPFSRPSVRSRRRKTSLIHRRSGYRRDHQPWLVEAPLWIRPGHYRKGGPDELEVSPGCWCDAPGV